MKILGLNISFGDNQEKTVQVKKPKPSASMNSGQSWVVSFDGEKNVGEIGPILRYIMDYHALSARSWQAYIESDIAKTITDRFGMWVMDKGLRLQTVPNTEVLGSAGVLLNREPFSKLVESRFAVWSNSNLSTYNEKTPFQVLSIDIFKHCKIGGDVLVVLRYVDKMVKVEMIDGAHIGSPLLEKPKYEGNRVVDGVEIDSRGRHVGYWVRKTVNDYEFIDAKSKETGLTVAFLVYGSKYRANNERGLPIIASSLETLKKIDRYKEAAVGSAEERQKIAFAIEHNQFSSGENPLGQLQGMFTDDESGETLPVNEDGEALARTVTATTNKQTFNMPVGATLKSLESKNEMFFKEFYSTNADIICGAFGIPPNVAWSIYNDSFSASRAATKDWEHTISVERYLFQIQLLKRVYQFWFHIEVLENRITAPGYLQAFYSNDIMVVEAYTTCRFTGPMFPHIDPLKEVRAEREKLGKFADNIPLTTLEQATENLMSGEYGSNVEQFQDEISIFTGLGFEYKEEPKTNNI
jgi:capsid protein